MHFASTPLKQRSLRTTVSRIHLSQEQGWRATGSLCGRSQSRAETTAEVKEPGRVFLEVTTTRSPTEFDAIKKEKPNKVKCDADEIEIFSQQDGKWIGEEKMSASLRDTDEQLRVILSCAVA
ncbi:unnamed protein product [Cladocopium goreaui]|uniref:Kinase D-interacting substrate of 220 kDa n=1 Tax=Cladocopium goreaui TaxID=2562237 RepID=A0A9P1DVW0_9DINO|nr:unnamed protein product [Cladocopium goreaui]